MTAAVRLITMIDGAWQTHAVAAFAELGLADLLADGARPVAELGEEAGADPALFRRFVRACRSLGLVTEEPPGTVRLTEMGALLRTAGASLRDFARVHASPGQLRPFERVVHALRDGSPTAVAALGEPIWEYYAKRPDEAGRLTAAIDGAAMIEVPAVVGAIDHLADCRVVVELRGSVSAILAGILDAAPRARGVLVDRPEFLAAARKRIAGHLGDRMETRPGSLLDPPQDLNADLYLISHGLQALDDEDARQALTRVRSASQRRTRLVILSTVLTPESPAVTNLLDLHGFMIFGGKERTGKELGALLAAAGWRLDRIAPTGFLAEVVIASPA